MYDRADMQNRSRVRICLYRRAQGLRSGLRARPGPKGAHPRTENEVMIRSQGVVTSDQTT